jgi:hypothetical protein
MAVGFASEQVLGVYRLKVGAFEITVLSDGNLPLETKLFSGDLARAEKMLEDAFLPKEATPTSVNEKACVFLTGEVLKAVSKVPIIARIQKGAPHAFCDRAQSQRKFRKRVPLNGQILGYRFLTPKITPQ